MPPIDRREYLKYTGALSGVPLLDQRSRADEQSRSASREISQDDSLPAPTRLRTEYEENPENLPPFADPATAGSGQEPFAPRFTWQVPTGARGGRQTAYRVLVASLKQVIAQDYGDVWDSGKIDSGQFTAVPYGGEMLEPDETYYWKVRVWDEDDESGEWSEPARFTMAIPDTPVHWEGEWIGNHPPAPVHEPSSEFQPARNERSPLLRQEFDLEKPVARARVHVAALGYGEVYANGTRIGDDVLNPAWTSYEDRVLYATYDVTELLQQGANALGLWLGRGWFGKTAEFPFGQLHEEADNSLHVPQYPTAPVASSWDAYGPPRALLQLDVEYADGTTTSVISDGSWHATESPVEENDIWDGERYDARKEQPGWAEPRFDDATWTPAFEVRSPSESRPLVGVNVVSFRDRVTVDPPADDAETLRPQRIDPIRVTETFDPVSIDQIDGDYVVDFGQNFAGWVELTVRGADEGDEITLEFAEVLHEDGDLDRRNLRTADATDVYVARGDDVEVYEPRFTYHGFRYAKISGYPGDLAAEDLLGKVVHTDFDERGTFRCSDGDLNQVQHMATWSLRSNAHSLPTDCPQRDERTGWGEIHRGAPSDLFNFEATRFYDKWLRDHEDNRADDGTHSDNIPDVWGGRPGDPNWSKSQVMVPWHLYEHTGDERFLEEYYKGMRAFVDFWHEQADDHIVPEQYSKYGDHVAPEGRLSTPGELLTTFAHYQTTATVADAAEILGRDDETVYRDRADAIAEAFNEEFLDPETNEYGTGTQGSYALPLFADIVPGERADAVVDNLARKIWEEDDGKLQTGSLTTRALIYSLAEHGREELAYHVVSQPERPGWVYMAQNGATSLWERWNSDDAQDTGMNSFNHRLWMEISAWFYQNLAGITLAEAGYEHVEFSPLVPTDLSWVETSVDTVRGEVRSAWERTDSGLVVEVTVPWNSTATVRVPDLGEEPAQLEESGRLIWNRGRTPGNFPKGVESVERADDAVVVEVGSGTYEFALQVEE